MTTELPQLQSKRPISILFGTGLNFLSDNYNDLDWDNLLKAIESNLNNKEKVEYANIPFTFRYEALYLRGTSSEKTLKTKVTELIKGDFDNEIYRQLVELHADHYLTTNYDHSFEKALQKIYQTRKVIFNDQDTNLKRKHIWEVTVNDGSTHKLVVWPIHGESNLPDSIMLGFDQYIGSITELYKYVKEQGFIDEMKKKGNMQLSDFQKFTHWIDTFFFSDLHIIGLGLDYSEIDIWWVLNLRKRFIKENIMTVENKIYYYPTCLKNNKNDKDYLDNEKIDYLKTLDVVINTDHGPLLKDDIEYNKNVYSKIVKEINNNILSTTPNFHNL